MTGANVPHVSLQRTLTILLILYTVAALLAFLAGATLIAHVDPYSECLLFSHVYNEKLYYGSEYYCEGIGYIFIACVVGAMSMFYVVFMHRRELISFYKSGEFTKCDAALTISNRVITSHATLLAIILVLAISITSGYQVACNNIETKMSANLKEKMNVDPTLTRGEQIDERFTDDNQFWRYTGRISNPFGSPIFALRITCRTIFTDPNVHQELHDNHVERFASYFGYWYKQDLFAYNSQYQSVLTNSLVEASMAGAWLSVLVWLGSFAFMIIQKYYIKRERWAADKVSLHSGEGSMRKDGSMLSGYPPSYGPPGSSLSRGPGTGFQRGGSRGSNASMKSARGSRRDVDDLGFMMAGVANPMHQPQPYIQQPGIGFPVGSQMYSDQEYHNQYHNQEQRLVYNTHQNGGIAEKTDTETEIM